MGSFLDILFPKRCLGCGKFGKYQCFKCQRTIKPLGYLKCPVCEKPAIDGMTHPKCRTKYTLDGLTSFFRYDGIIKKAIKQIKYRFVSDIVNELIDCIPTPSLHMFHTPYLIHNTLYLIPIPLHPSRYKFRGFNQAEVIAKALSKRLNIPVNSNLLIRMKKTKPQVEMKDKEKRLENMKNVFSLPTSYLLPHNSCILLIDDVFTTGATLRSAASVLKRHGAKFVWGVTIAQ